MVMGLALAWALSLLALLLYERGFHPKQLTTSGFDFFDCPGFRAEFTDKRDETFFFLTYYILAPLSVWGIWKFKIEMPRLAVLLTWVSVSLFLAQVALAVLLMEHRKAHGTFVGILAIATLLWPILRGLKRTRFFPQSGKDLQYGRESEGVLSWHWSDLVWAVLVFLALRPFDVTEVARMIGFDQHPTAYLLGPALYFRDTALLPGRDYFLQYGIGPAWLFSKLLRTDALGTLENYVDLVSGGLIVFFVWNHLLNRRIFPSKSWAWLASLATAFIVLPVHVQTPMYFNAPSSLPFRFLLYPIYFLLVGIPVGGSRVKVFLRGLAASLVIGLGLFWNLETGIYLLLTALVLAPISDGPFKLKNWVEGAAVAASSVAAFVWISALVFGPSALTLTYLKDLLEPLIVYGSGYSGQPINWKTTLAGVQNLLIPAIGLVTLGLSLGNSGWVKDRNRRILVALSVAGLLLFYKYLNRSFQTLLHFNGFFLLSLGFYWLSVGWTSIFMNRRQKGLAGAAVALLLIGYHFEVNRISIPESSYYLGAQAWKRYPSLLKYFLTGFQAPSLPPPPMTLIETSVFQRRPISSDVELMKKMVAPDEPLLYLSPYFDDWGYLVGAQRVPALKYLPGKNIHFRSQLLASLESAKTVFVSKPDPLFPPPQFCEDFEQTFRKYLATHFERAEEGEAVESYRRKSTSNR